MNIEQKVPAYIKCIKLYEAYLRHFSVLWSRHNIASHRTNKRRVGGSWKRKHVEPFELYKTHHYYVWVVKCMWIILMAQNNKTQTKNVRARNKEKTYVAGKLPCMCESVCVCSNQGEISIQKFINSFNFVIDIFCKHLIGIRSSDINDGLYFWSNWNIDELVRCVGQQKPLDFCIHCNGESSSLECSCDVQVLNRFILSRRKSVIHWAHFETIERSTQT